MRRPPSPAPRPAARAGVSTRARRGVARGRPPLDDDAGLDRLHGAPAGVGQHLGGGGEGDLLEVLDGGEDQQDVPCAVCVERPGGGEPAELDALLAVHARRLPGRAEGEEEVGVEAGAHRGGGDPAGELDELPRRRGRATPASSRSSRTAAARCARSSSPSACSTAPPGNTHTPPMKRALGLRLTSSSSRPSLVRRAAGSRWRPGAGSWVFGARPRCTPRRDRAARRWVACSLH